MKLWFECYDWMLWVTKTVAIDFLWYGCGEDLTCINWGVHIERNYTKMYNIFYLQIKNIIKSPFNAQITRFCGTGSQVEMRPSYLLELSLTFFQSPRTAWLEDRGLLWMWKWCGRRSEVFFVVFWVDVTSKATLMLSEGIPTSSWGRGRT